MTRLKTQPFERNVALTRLGLGTGGRFVAHSVANVFRSESQREEADRAFYLERAQELARALGELKGSVMKAGQMLSLYGQYFLPPEAVAVLAGLQDNTPAVAWPVVAPVLERALGRRLHELEISEVPMAAASLGQAHRARRKSDGLELVVKIQYPGVADAIESDIRSLSRLVGLSRLAPKGLDLDPIFNEVREMLHREVDYDAEARFTRTFGERLADDPRFAVPTVLTEYSTDRVLTTTFEHGLSVRSPEVSALSQARRDRLGRHFLELFLTEFFDWGMVQSDPHFGNYRLRLDEGGEDRIVLLDFGATRMFCRAFIADYSDIVAGALEGDEARIHRGARAIGLMGQSFPPGVMEAFARLCIEIVEPFDLPGAQGRSTALMDRAGVYDWGASDLPMRVGRIASRNALSRYFRVPPREIVFLHRRLAGVFIMLSTLGVRLRTREALLSALATAADKNGG